MARLVPYLAFALPFALAGQALAEPTGHYDPDRIPPASRVFVEVSKASGAAVTPIERRLVQADGALADLAVALGLTAGSVDEARHGLWKARLDERSTRFGIEAEGFQQEVYAMGDGFQKAFEDATTRAVAALEGEVVPCRAPRRSALGALAGRDEAPTSTCPGTDHSEAIAAAWDADSILAEAIAPLRDPLKTSVTTYEEKAEVLGLGGNAAGTTWVAPVTLASAIPEAMEILDAIDARAEEARGVLRGAQRSLTKDDPLAEDMVKAIRNRARGIRTWTDEKRSMLGRAVFDALERRRKRDGKKGGWKDVGVCVNPEVWNACDGKDVSEDVAQALLKDKKLVSALDDMLIDLAEPETSLD